MTTPDNVDVESFWAAAQELLARPGINRSTMMGYPCLRYNGDFFASYDPNDNRLILKLDAREVVEMIARGAGRAFAPAGKPFKEWVAVNNRDTSHWPAHLERAAHYANLRNQL